MTASVGPPPTVEPPPPPIGREPAFRLLWVGEGVSVVGNATSAVLLPLLAVETLRAGPGWMGVLTAAAWVPWLLIGLPAGAWVDRWSARRVMIVADLASAAVIAVVPVAWALGVLSLPVLVATAFGAGTATVFFRAAYPALVRQVAAPEQQEHAFARLIGTESVAQVGGPGLGGVLAQVVSAAAGLVIDAVSFVVSACCLWRMRPPRSPAPPVAVDATIGERIREGVAYLRGDRLLRHLTVTGGLSNFGLTGYTALLVLFLVRAADLSSAAVGAVLAAGAVGGALGAAAATRLASRWGTARAVRHLQLVAGPPALLVGLGGPGAGVAPVVAGLALVGFGVVAGNVIRNAWRNRYVPDHLVARQVTVAQVVNFGTMPVAALTAGWLGAHLGVRPTILAMAAVHGAACLAVAVGPLRPWRDLPVADGRGPSAHGDAA